jgi:uncharacterized membrane protein
MTDDTLPWEDDAGAPAPPPLPQWRADEAFAFAWRVVMNDPLVLMLLTVGIVGSLFMELIGVSVHYVNWVNHRQFAGAVVHAMLWIVNVPLQAFATIGVWRIALKVVRGQKARLEDLWEGGPFTEMIVAVLLVTLGVSLGLALCVVPGVLLLIGWSFFAPLMLDRRLDGFEGLRQSWILTRGHGARLFTFWLLALACVAVGSLACGVGAFVAAAFVTVAAAWVYQRVSGQPVVEPR